MNDSERTKSFGKCGGNRIKIRLEEAGLKYMDKINLAQDSCKLGLF